MRITLVIALLLAVVSVSAIREKAKDNLDEIEQLDTTVFGESSAKPADSLAAAEAALGRAQDSEAVAERGVEDAIADSSAESEGEDATLYSFRAMNEATTLAGTSVSEKADETHEISARFLSAEDNADKMFAEINREQQILMAKKALVARQKQSIHESEESLHKLENLIDENKSILRKNQRALRRASNDLIKLIAKYQRKLTAGLTVPTGESMDHLMSRHLSDTDEEDDEDDEASKEKVKSLPHHAAAVSSSTAEIKAAEVAAKAKLEAHKKASSTTTKKKKLTLQSTAPLTGKKMTFSQLHSGESEESEEAEESEEDSEEEESEEESGGSEEEESAEGEESDESEADESADESQTEEGEEAEEADESDESEEAEEEESDEGEEEEEAESFVEHDSRVDREPALFGLPPPPAWETNR